MTGHNIICLAPTEWNGAWQRYQEIMRRLARAGDEVLVVDNIYRVSVPAPTTLSMAGRMAQKAWRVLRQIRLTPRIVAPHLRVLSPPLVPVAGLERLAWPILRVGLRRSGLDARRSPILWCAFPTPLVRFVVEELQPRLVVYDCASAFKKDPSIDSSVVGAEGWLLQRADIVFADSRTLWEEHSRVHDRCYWVPTGVDYVQFAHDGLALRRSGDRPVIGYVGTLHRWLDIQMITTVVEAHPEWTFVFVGPRRARADLGRLERLPNVQLIGPRPHDALPAILAEFDVAWIPYQTAEFTRYVFPTKLLEYLAAGRAVVSTDLPEVRAFAPPVRIGTTAHEIAKHIGAALRERVDDRGQELARTFDWQIQMAQIHRHLDRALSETQGRR